MFAGRGHPIPPVLVLHADSVTNEAFHLRFRISRAWRRPSSVSHGRSTMAERAGTFVLITPWA